MSVKARAVEALAGAGVGAVGGAATGGLTYKSDMPKEWVDDDGLMYSRPYDKEEKQQRRGRMLRAALIGAGLGGVGSVGAGAVRRAGVDAAEAAEAPKMDEEYLAGLRNIIQGTEVGAADAQRRGQRLRLHATTAHGQKAKALLKEQQGALVSSLEEAKKSRGDRPWGGYFGRPDAQAHEELTHRGRVNRHFEDLRVKHNLPRMQGLDTKADEFGKDYFNALLEKKSEVAQTAFFHELRAIDTHARG